MQTVARAFYVDSVVVVLDSLIREKFIREEELGPRLRMSQKQAREVIALLYDVEMLVRCEELPLHRVDSSAPINSKQTVKLYYVDYQSFVNIVRLRIYFMLKTVQSEEKAQVDDIYYECPTCKTKYTSLQAMRQRSADFKFICTSCCPEFNISKTISQPSFRLREVDNRGNLSEVQKLEKRIIEQLSRNSDHDGILEMLEDLKDIDLPRNKPSSNLVRGVRSSTVKNEDITEEIGQNIASKNVKSVVDIKEKHFNLLSTRLDGTKTIIEKDSIEIEGKTAEDVKISSDVTDDADFQAIKRARQSELPVFLNESGVKGSSAIMQEVHALHIQRGTATIDAPAASTVDKSKPSTVIFSRESQSIISTLKEDTDAKEAEDDIDWEEDDEDS